MRLFFGLSLSEEARDAVAEAARAVRCEKGRFQERDNYHLTLVFLGATPAGAVKQLRRLGQMVLREPFELTLAPEMGTFKEGSILWAGVADCPALTTLQRRQSLMLRENGFPGGDEPYRPHITVGRGMRGIAFTPRVAPAVPSCAPSAVQSTISADMATLPSASRKSTMAPLPGFRRLPGFTSASQ